MAKCIERRIGVTTSWMPADRDDLFFAIDRAHGAGMRVKVARSMAGKAETVFTIPTLAGPYVVE